MNNPEAFARRGEDKLVVMASNVRERERETVLKILEHLPDNPVVQFGQAAEGILPLCSHLV